MRIYIQSKEQQVVIRINHGGILDGYWTEYSRNCHSKFDAIAHAKILSDDLAQSIKDAREIEYQEGYEHGKKKRKRLKEFFRRWF